MMDKKTVETLKSKLEEKRNEIKTELESFAKEDNKIKGNWDAKYPSKERGNKEEEADEAGEYENLLSLEQSLELKLKDVETALSKIESEIYGKCERCGKNIEEERLMAYPEARLCIICNK